MRIYPKLNIFLNVFPRNAQFFHPIFSRFILAQGSIYDEMEIRFGQDRFEIYGEFGCDMHKNLIFKAKEVLKKAFPTFSKELESCRVEVQKHIPKGAGLGGGSANAGAFMREFARVFEIDLCHISKLAKDVGCDVGFFVSGYESANVLGYGEIVEEFIEGVPYEYEIYTPDIFCDTQAVYQSFDTLGISNSKIAFLNHSSMDLLFTYTQEELNDLFIPATKIYPALLEVSKELGKGWFFSGSGSSFFRLRM